MLEVILDYVPYGVESKRTTLEKLTIENTGKNQYRPEYGNYICHYPNGSFEVVGHKRSEGAWSLVRKCLHEYLGHD